MYQMVTESKTVLLLFGEGQHTSVQSEFRKRWSHLDRCGAGEALDDTDLLCVEEPPPPPPRCLSDEPRSDPSVEHGALPGCSRSF